MIFESENASREVLNAWLEDLAQAIRLREGSEGVSRPLWVLYSETIRSTREWSRRIKIPVPVLAALRRELEKRDILETGKKIALTEAGIQRMKALFGRCERLVQTCSTCLGRGRILPPEAMPVLEEFRILCERRPDVDVTLDQSHATPETGIRKALLLLEMGLLGQPVFFLGDDDLISIACFLVRKHFLPDASRMASLFVADIDTRYLDLISELSDGSINVLQYDVRNEFPDELKGKFKAVLTDPAYTENAITAFSYRCYSSLGQGGNLLLSMPIPDAETLLAIERNLIETGWSIQDIRPQFNEYEGASIHAHQSSLFICEKVFSLPPEKSPDLRYTPFYTGDVRPPGGTYICTSCSMEFQIGCERKHVTIKELKRAGCPECGNQTFRRAGPLKENESKNSGLPDRSSE